jgi:CheY-like chemotaxis protein
MVHQLLAFSRRQLLQPKLLDINQAVRGMVRLLQQFVGEHIQVQCELMPTALIAKMDPTGLEQVVMNLCANARDSMSQGGTLTIRTGLVQTDAAFVDAHAGAKANAYVRLSVQDTGTGMDPNVAAHIFEPFFTTKQTGKGTGLGLAVVYGLVQQHEGFVDIQTSPGNGTTFSLYFPFQDVRVEGKAVEGTGTVTPQAAERSVTTAPPSPRAGAALQFPRSRVLVVDDDPAIRRLCERILQKAYEVTTVPSGRAALDELERRSYDLLLSDLRMPNMDGVSLLKEVMKLKGAPRLMAMTGSVPREMEQLLQSVPLDARIIHKPFTALSLLEAITQCLSERNSCP